MQTNLTKAEMFKQNADIRKELILEEKQEHRQENEESKRKEQGSDSIQMKAKAAKLKLELIKSFDRGNLVHRIDGTVKSTG